MAVFVSVPLEAGLAMRFLRLNAVGTNLLNWKASTEFPMYISVSQLDFLKNI